MIRYHYDSLMFLRLVFGGRKTTVGLRNPRCMLIRFFSSSGGRPVGRIRTFHVSGSGIIGRMRGTRILPFPVVVISLISIVGRQNRFPGGFWLIT